MQRFINILHLSDFHHRERSAESEDVVVTALIADLKQIRNTELAPDICIFSGDLVYSADDNLYDEFRTGVLDVIAEATGLPHSKIIVCPGNHDISRTVSDKNGPLLSSIRDAADIISEFNSELKSGALESHIAEAFAGYNKLVSDIGGEGRDLSDPFCAKYTIDDIGLKCAVLNSAALSFGGLKSYSKDERRLALPEYLFLNGPKSISAFEPDIVVLHHPPSALHPSIEPLLRGARLGNAHVVAFGHMHTPRPISNFEDENNRLINQSGALFYHSHRDKEYKGYAIISLDRDERLYKVHHRAYYPERLRFDLALQHYEEGTYYSSPSAKSHFLSNLPSFNRATLLQWSETTLKADLEEKLHAHLKRLGITAAPVTPHFEIEGLASAIKDVVAPTNPETEDLGSLLARPDHVLIQGRQEAGKSTALLMWARDRSRRAAPFNRVPAYCSWSDLPKGPDAFTRLVKRSLPDLPQGFQMRDLLQRGAVEVLIDDFVVTGEAVECLSAAIRAYPGCRFVVGYKSKAISELGFASFVPESIPFLSTRLIQLRRGQIRALVKSQVTLPKPAEDALVKDIMRELVQNNLPLTAFTILSAMQVYGSEGAFRFNNKANFLERLIEIKLEKHAASELKVGSFDFSNKVRCLAHLAKWMVEKDKYTIGENELFGVIKDHIDEHGFDIPIVHLIRHFYDAGIIERDANGVRFTFMCFLEFFIAKQMMRDKEFRDHVTSEANYLAFPNETALYFALSREDAELLDAVARRLDKLRMHMRENYQAFSENAGEKLDSIKVTRGGASEAELEEYESTIRNPQLSDDDRDALLDGETPKDVGNRQEVYRPQILDPESQWLYALLLYSSMVRSCDYLPASAREKHVNHALASWLEFLEFSLNIVPSLAERGVFKIDEVEFTIPGLMDMEMADRYRALQVLMPVGVTRMLSYYMNTDKLRNQIKNPNPGGESGFMSLMRMSLLLDLSYEGLCTDVEPLFENARHKSHYAGYVGIRKSAETYSQNRLMESDRRPFAEMVSDAIGRLKATSKATLGDEKAKVFAGLERDRLRIQARERGGS